MSELVQCFACNAIEIFNDCDSRCSVCGHFLALPDMAGEFNTLPAPEGTRPISRPPGRSVRGVEEVDQDLDRYRVAFGQQLEALRGELQAELLRLRELVRKLEKQIDSVAMRANQ